MKNIQNFQISKLKRHCIYYGANFTIKYGNLNFSLTSYEKIIVQKKILLIVKFKIYKIIPNHSKIL